MNREELVFLSVAEQSELLGNGELSPVELTEAYLERTERLNSRLFAYITVAAEKALEQARRAEVQIRQGECLGPLHGIPIAVKDQMWTEGIRTTNASFLLRDFVPEEDATVIARIKEAGAVLLGKLNMSEFASGGRFMFPYGRTRNRGTRTTSRGHRVRVRGPLLRRGCAPLRWERTLRGRYGILRRGAGWWGFVRHGVG